MRHTTSALIRAVAYLLFSVVILASVLVTSPVVRFWFWVFDTES